MVSDEYAVFCPMNHLFYPMVSPSFYQQIHRQTDFPGQSFKMSSFTILHLAFGDEHLPIDHMLQLLVIHPM